MKDRIKRLLIAIAIAVVVMGATALIFQYQYNQTAPSEEDILAIARSGTTQDAQELITRSEKADSIRTLAWIVLGVEGVIALGAIATQW